MKPLDGVPGIAGVAVGGVRPDRTGEPQLQPPGAGGGLPLPGRAPPGGGVETWQPPPLDATTALRVLVQELRSALVARLPPPANGFPPLPPPPLLVDDPGNAVAEVLRWWQGVLATATPAERVALSSALGRVAPQAVNESTTQAAAFLARSAPPGAAMPDFAPLLGTAASQLSRALAAAAGWGERFAERPGSAAVAAVVTPPAEESPPGTPTLLYAPPGTTANPREVRRPPRRRRKGDDAGRILPVEPREGSGERGAAADDPAPAGDDERDEDR